MHRYIVNRLLYGALVLLGVSVVIFLFVRLLPGDIAILQLGEGSTTEENLARIRKKLGVDQPLHIQYFKWIGNALRGDLGKSLYSERSVSGEIAKRFPVTLELTLLAMLVSLSIAMPIGVVAAIRQDTPLDYLLRVVGILGISIPGFWIGTLMIIVPALLFGISPPVDFKSFFVDPVANLRHLILPALALGFALSGSVMRMTRSSLLEVLRQDYIRTAWSKGLRERVVIVRHALKNAFIPVVTLAGVQLGNLLGGSVIMETIFGVPGIGKLTVEAFFIKDFTQVQGNILVFSLVFIAINLLVDITYGWLDPRIRYS